MTFLGSNSFFLAVLSSLLLWLSFPGGGEAWPLLPVALVPLLVAIKAADGRRAALAGLCCGFLHFVSLLYWIIIVLGRYGGLGWFISLQALLLLALYMSLYFALFAFFASFLLRSFPAVVSLWLLPALWVGLDWLRSVFLTGFPWMDLGYALYRVPKLIQIADLVGHHGITYLLVFVNCLVLLLLSKKTVTDYLLLLLPALCLLGAAGGYSSLRFQEIHNWEEASGTSRIRVGIVQGNIDQSVKWSPEMQQQTVADYLRLTGTLFDEGHPDLVVWPETALPFYPPSNTYMQPLRDLVGSRDTALLTGAPWYEIIDSEKQKVKFFNSALLLQPDGNFGGKYYKSHLVPFGEYIPLKKLLPFLAPLVEAVGDFSAGTIERPLIWRGARAGILICFESVFPELSRRWVLAGANVLVNLTNDAWYGKSSAPYQSLAMSVLRAVETRRSLVRSANTGVSAFVSPSGVIRQQSGIFVDWAGSEQLVLSNRLTFWARYGHLFAPLCLVLALVSGLVAMVMRR